MAAKFPPEALVVRGGECAVEVMRLNAENHHAKRGEHAVSAWCVPGLDAEATAHHARQQGKFYLRQGSLRVISAGELEDRGFPVVPDEPPAGHVAIMLSSPLSPAELQLLNEIFGPIIKNPVAC